MTVPVLVVIRVMVLAATYWLGVDSFGDLGTSPPLSAPNHDADQENQGTNEHLNHCFLLDCHHDQKAR
jgi:hypothetical protein